MAQTHQQFGISRSQSYLRVLLRVEAEELQHLHWERLCARTDQDFTFLSHNHLTPFSIYIHPRSTRPFPPITTRDLKALVLVAGPGDLINHYGAEPFDTAAIAGIVLDGFSKAGIPAKLLANLPGAAGSPDINSLSQSLVSGGYNLLHIVCHGRSSQKSGDTLLLFPDERGEPVRGSTLLSRLGLMQSTHELPYFTFLMSCDSAPPQNENGFPGLGQQLVRNLGMPAALAMTDRISIETANILAGSFYSRLAAHGHPDLAMSEVITQVAGRLDSTVPAVFSCLGDQPLFATGAGGEQDANGDIHQAIAKLQTRLLLPDQVALRRKTVSVFLNLECMTDSRRREDVVRELPGNIRNNIARRDDNRGDVLAILNTVLNYENGLQQLIEAIESNEPGEIKIKELHAWLLGPELV